MFDGADIVNGILYAAEGDYVNAAISFACGIPAVGTVIAGVAKMSKAAKAMKAADRIADLCKAAGKVGNTAAGMKANYDTYMQARREGKSVGEAMTYMAGAMMAGLAMGKAASWGANKLKNLANKALPKLKTAVQEGAGKLASKISKGLSSSGSGRMNRNRGYIVNPFYKGGSKTVNPKDVNFMQSSIRNQTGEHTVLGNAEALKNGTLQATDLPEIRIWQDADGKLWTLDHRRLAAFRIAGLDSVPFRWATDEEIASQMWKMTTKTNGTSVKLKLGNGKSMTIQ